MQFEFETLSAEFTEERAVICQSFTSEAARVMRIIPRIAIVGFISLPTLKLLEANGWFTSAQQGRDLRGCSKFCTACKYSENYEFTVWARHRTTPHEGPARALKWRTAGPFTKIAQISVRSAILRASSSSTPR